MIGSALALFRFRLLVLPQTTGPRSGTERVGSGRCELLTQCVPFDSGVRSKRMFRLKAAPLVVRSQTTS